MDRAACCPRFKKNDLEKETRLKLKATLLLEEKGNSHTYSTYITNIDKESAFLLLQQEDFSEMRKLMKGKGSCRLVCSFDSVTFSQSVRIVTAYDRGFGVEFVEAKEMPDYNWQTLYKICLERGYFV